MGRPLIRYFRMTSAAYETLYLALNALHGFPSGAAESALMPAAGWPVDSDGNIFCVIDGTYCEKRIPAGFLSAAGIQELSQEQFAANLPQTP
jgi:hypothetical protein